MDACSCWNSYNMQAPFHMTVEFLVTYVKLKVGPVVTVSTVGSVGLEHNG